MDISYDKKNHTYKIGDVVLSKKEFNKYIDDDMLQACISNCPVNIECAETNDAEIIENEYHRAANTLLDYINEYSLELDSCADSVNAVVYLLAIILALVYIEFFYVVICGKGAIDNKISSTVNGNCIVSISKRAVGIYTKLTAEGHTFPALTVGLILTEGNSAVKKYCIA